MNENKNTKYLDLIKMQKMHKKKLKTKKKYKIEIIYLNSLMIKSRNVFEKLYTVNHNNKMRNPLLS